MAISTVIERARDFIGLTPTQAEDDLAIWSCAHCGSDEGVYLIQTETYRSDKIEPEDGSWIVRVDQANFTQAPTLDSCIVCAECEQHLNSSDLDSGGW